MMQRLLLLLLPALVLALLPQPSLPQLLWRQEPFTEEKSPEANFAGWNANIMWGPEEDQLAIVGDSLQVRYPKGSTVSSSEHGGVGLYATPVDLSQVVEREVTLEYELMFGESFDWVKGGKIPGLYGGHISCSGGHDSEDCWSMRFMWRKDGDGEVYAYLPDEQEEGFCDDWDVHCNYEYGHSLGRGTWRFEAGRWHLLKQRVILNKVDSMDGSVIVSLDGEEVYRRDGLNIRKFDKVGFEGIQFQTFYGGSDSSWAPPLDTWAYFRNCSLSV